MATGLKLLLGNSEVGGNVCGAGVLTLCCRSRREGRPGQLAPLVLALLSVVGCGEHDKPAAAAASGENTGAWVQQPVASRQQEQPEEPALTSNGADDTHGTAGGEGTSALDAGAGGIAPPADRVAGDKKAGNQGDDLVDAPQEDAGAGQAAGKVLDLGYKPDPAAAGGEGQAITADGGRKLLPDLFGEKSPDDGVSVSGGLLLDDEKERVRDSLNGAQVSVEFKTR
jgi:hypothetical protein